MLVTRITQKEGSFYFIAYDAGALLDRVSFSSRYYFEGEQIEADEPGEDEVAKFIAGIEKSEKSFQRLRSEEHTSELQSPDHLVCRLLLEKKKKKNKNIEHKDKNTNTRTR